MAYEFMLEPRMYRGMSDALGDKDTIKFARNIRPEISGWRVTEKHTPLSVSLPGTPVGGFNGESGYSYVFVEVGGATRVYRTFAYGSFAVEESAPAGKYESSRLAAGASYSGTEFGGYVYWSDGVKIVRKPVGVSGLTSSIPVTDIAPVEDLHAYFIPTGSVNMATVTTGASAGSTLASAATPEYIHAAHKFTTQAATGTHTATFTQGIVMTDMLYLILIVNDPSIISKLKVIVTTGAGDQTAKDVGDNAVVALLDAKESGGVTQYLYQVGVPLNFSGVTATAIKVEYVAEAATSVDIYVVAISTAGNIPGAGLVGVSKEHDPGIESPGVVYPPIEGSVISGHGTISKGWEQRYAAAPEYTYAVRVRLKQITNAERDKGIANFNIYYGPDADSLILASRAPAATYGGASWSHAGSRAADEQFYHTFNTRSLEFVKMPSPLAEPPANVFSMARTAGRVVYGTTDGVLVSDHDHPLRTRRVDSDRPDSGFFIKTDSLVHLAVPVRPDTQVTVSSTVFISSGTACYTLDQESRALSLVLPERAESATGTVFGDVVFNTRSGIFSVLSRDVLTNNLLRGSYPWVDGKMFSRRQYIYWVPTNSANPVFVWSVDQVGVIGPWTETFPSNDNPVASTENGRFLGTADAYTASSSGLNDVVITPTEIFPVAGYRYGGLDILTEGITADVNVLRETGMTDRNSNLPIVQRNVAPLRSGVYARDRDSATGTKGGIDAIGLSATISGAMQVGGIIRAIRVRIEGEADFVE